MRKYLTLFVIYLLIGITYAVEVYMPTSESEWWSEGASFAAEWSSASWWWLGLFNVINKYMWYVLWLLLIFVLWYAGMLLIISEWDDKALQRSNKIVIYAFIWIAIVVSSYFFIRLIVNLF